MKPHKKTTAFLTDSDITEHKAVVGKAKSDIKGNPPPPKKQKTKEMDFDLRSVGDHISSFNQRGERKSES